MINQVPIRKVSLAAGSSINNRGYHAWTSVALQDPVCNYVTLVSCGYYTKENPKNVVIQRK